MTLRPLNTQPNFGMAILISDKNGVVKDYGDPPTKVARNLVAWKMTEPNRAVFTDTHNTAIDHAAEVIIDNYTSHGMLVPHPHRINHEVASTLGYYISNGNAKLQKTCLMLRS